MLFGARRTITIPLEIDGRRIGIMHVDNKRTGPFTMEDLRTLTFFAPHLALFIENARLYECEKAYVDDLVRFNDQMLSFQQRLETLVYNYNALTRQVLSEKGINFVVDTLADLVGAPVFVEDTHRNLLISAEPPLASKVNVKGFANLPIINHDFYAEAVGDRVKIVAPITNGKNIMGYFKTILDPFSVHDDLTMATIEHGAAILGLHMVKEQMRLVTESRWRREFLDGLFYGHPQGREKVYELASFYNYDLNSASRVAIISIDQYKDLVTKSSDGHRYGSLVGNLTDLIIALTRKVMPGVFTGTNGGEIELLVPMGSLRSADLIVGLENIIEQASRLHPDIKIFIGVGGVCTKAEDYGKSLKCAKQALSIGRALDDRGRVFIHDRLGAYSLLLEISDREIVREFVRSRIGPLLDHDNRRNLSLTETLEKYLRTGCSLKETAQSLFIHVATLKYRLRRIEELVHVDLKDPETRFDLRLALYANRVLSNCPAG